MNFIPRVVLGCFVGLVAASCAGGTAPDSALKRETDSVAATTAALTDACTMDTIGFPCDPDGPAGTLLECQGVCGISSLGLLRCLPISSVGLTNLDGRVCGSAGAIGDAACAKHCFGKACVAGFAVAGAACRPNQNSAACDGQCDGGGNCSPIAPQQRCTYGRVEQLCTFNTCNCVNATECVTQNMRRNTPCSLTDACSLGACGDDDGVCVPGSTKGCDDGNACTDDTCDPNDGSCIGAID